MKRHEKNEAGHSPAAFAAKHAFLLRTLLFLLILAVALGYLTRVFTIRDDKHAEKTFRSFYRQEENSLDGIYIGSSAAYRYWVPALAYQQSGMTVYNLGTGSQPVVLQKYIIEEALKTQPDMKFILIDIRSLLSDSSRLKESDIRRVTDSMKWSTTRFEAIDAALSAFSEAGADISYEKSGYYFPFLLYHNRWTEDLTTDDFLHFSAGNYYKGFQMTARSLATTPLAEPSYTTEIGELDEQRVEILEDLLDYCGTLDQTVIFISSPYAMPEDEQKVMNRCMQIIEDAGFPTIDFNTPGMAGSLGLDWSNDFMDKNHVNFYGAKKYTAWLTHFLAQNFDLEDHRGEDGYESWDLTVYRTGKKYLKLFAESRLPQLVTHVMTGEWPAAKG